MSNSIFPAVAINMAPKFNASPEHIVVKEGERVTLPCSLDRKINSAPLGTVTNNIQCLTET